VLFSNPTTIDDVRRVQVPTLVLCGERTTAPERHLDAPGSQLTAAPCEGRVGAARPVRYGPAMDPAAYARFTAALTARLEMDPDVLGLVALGSMSGEPPGPDAWSDHDFFVVTRPGAQERLRVDPAWLPESGRIVLWHRETAHGLKAVWDDGHLAELAVFDPDELALARVNRFRVLLDRGDVAARMAAVRSATAARGAAESPDLRWLGGQFLGELLVGAGRAARGERTSGHFRVRSQALVHLLQLVHRLVPPTEGAVPDELDPSRRVERAWPALARELDAALGLPVPAAAAALLDAADHALGERAPWPAAAAAAVRRKIAEARAAAGPRG
jgi:hypothetical protein